MTKFKVEIHADGGETPYIISMIGSHNSGKTSISLTNIIGYLTCRAVMYQSYKSQNLSLSDDGNTLLITDEGIPILTIQECEI